MTKIFFARTLTVFFTLGLLTLHSLAAPNADSLLLNYSKSVIKEADLQGAERSQFSTELLKSNDWQHELWDSGLIKDPAATLQSLYHMWKSDPDMVEHTVNRQMATALALETPIRNWEQEEINKRYAFFKSRYQYGLLNVNYAKLGVFERRYLAHGVQHQHFNPIESMEYLNDEISIPAEKYTGACWYPHYLSNNPFGDSIHGPHYYRPFQGAWGSPAEMVRKVGGVCGSLSNFGAAAAIANGIPAATMGEPGHCAYTVLVKPGEWVPTYTLSWQRWLHNAYYSGTWGWHILNNKAHASRQNANASGDLRRLTQHHLKSRRNSAALQSIRAARTRYPLDWANWQLSVEILKQTKASASEWQALHQDIIKCLTPISSEVTFHLLDKHIYDQVLPKNDNETNLRHAILLTFHRAFNDWGLGRWNFAEALKSQLKRLGENQQDQDRFMEEVFTIHAKGNVFSAIVLEEQLKRIGDDGKRRQLYIANISKALSRGGKGDAYKNTIESMASKILPYAASQGDRSTFQFIGKMASEFYPACDVSPRPFSGQLLSSGGVFSIAKPGNRWDSPTQHWGIIEPHGGYFHTDHTPATATVQLGNFGRLSGIVIVTSNGHFQRLENAILQVSTDGQQWRDIHTFKEHQRVHRIDLKGKDIDAGYVRVTQPNHPSIHFNKFHVYGKKQN